MVKVKMGGRKKKLKQAIAAAEAASPAVLPNSVEENSTTNSSVNATSVGVMNVPNGINAMVTINTVAAAITLRTPRLHLSNRTNATAQNVTVLPIRNQMNQFRVRDSSRSLSRRQTSYAVPQRE